MSQIHTRLENWEKEQLPLLLDEPMDVTPETESPRISAVDAIIRIAVSSAERALRVKRRIADVSVRKPISHTEPAFEHRIVGLFAE